MKKIKVVVVDDSPFSIMLLKDMLIQNNFEVVGDASSLAEAIEVVTRENPDVVTMDMTLPGTDGIECTKAIHKINPSIKVIVVSSMMDEEIVRKARKANVSAYLQKPVEAEELTLTINRTMSDDELFDELEDLYHKAFKEAYLDIFNKMLKSVPKFQEENYENIEWRSLGLAVTVGIIGRYSGRVIFDMSLETARKITLSVIKRAPKNDDEVIYAMSEFTNIATGNACSIINRKNKLFGLRVAPPTVFHGEAINVSKSNLDNIFTTKAKTDFGDVYINVGFKKGVSEWI
ncbi:response regulator [Clostridium sp. 19966]|uniref:response regulator n=1 Tax=Clostridium sp. 19966 TaxID=2768166 RepID=UPI0028DD78B2|nr:response regulator [Clostridium sp. 19966]MDT8715178.1 response regulator [Clostridium sp. 19966]